MEVERETGTERSITQELPDDVKRKIFGEVKEYTPEERTEAYDKFIKYANITSEEGYLLVKRFKVNLGKTPNKKIKKPPRHTLKRLSYRERKKLGLYSLAKNSLRYEDMLPLHYLWKEYMMECLNVSGIIKNGWSNTPDNAKFDQISLKLFRADYHGCIMTVIRSSCPGYVGKSGIVAMETKNCFKLVTVKNIVNTIPKAVCEFEFHLDGLKFSFFGKNLVAKPADRSSKKVKTIQEYGV